MAKSDPMTPDQFRRSVMLLPGAEEHEHHRHPDFRVGGKIFATMGYPDEKHAMVKLTPEQQAELIHDHPEVFSPCAGKWGEQGATSINLKKAKKAIIQRAIEAARQNAQWAALAAATRGRKASAPTVSKPPKKNAMRRAKPVVSRAGKK
jgi:hypothetical protein